MKEKSEYPATETADGKPFSHAESYFFFDADTAGVRDTRALRRVDAETLGSFGLRIVAISKLRCRKDDAIADGQKILLDKIEAIRVQIRQLEEMKSPKERSLKAFLMSH